MRELQLWGAFLLGKAPAIRELAGRSSTLWVGLCLVLLTGIARQYDQSWIGDSAPRWFLGPLAVSLVSAAWQYFLGYGWMVRRELPRDDPPKKSGFRVFLSMFWMTAPVAWMYALPVERFLDPVESAKANIALLLIVSAWRVILLARVFNVLCRLTWLAAGAVVLLGAGIETLVITLFGNGLFARQVMSAMGGIPLAPHEEVLVDAVGTVFMAALCSLPFTAMLSLFSRSDAAQALPAVTPHRIAWRPLAGLLVLWVGIAVLPQREVFRSVTADRRLANGEYRATLDYLAAHSPRDFAPARTLVPAPYERKFLSELPALLAATTERDPEWLRQHLVARADLWWQHAAGRAEPERAKLVNALQSSSISPVATRAMLAGLNRSPEGRAWLSRDRRRREALEEFTRQPAQENSPGTAP